MGVFQIVSALLVLVLHQGHLGGHTDGVHVRLVAFVDGLVGVHHEAFETHEVGRIASVFYPVVSLEVLL